MTVISASDSFIRPSDTTAYAANDIIANSTTAGLVVPLRFNVGRGGFRIVGIRLNKSDETDVANSAITMHFYGSSPTIASGDNAALSTSFSDKFGIVALATMVATTDEAFQVINKGDTGFLGGLYHYSSTGNIYGLLMATAAYSPASAEVFQVKLIFDVE